MVVNGTELGTVVRDGHQARAVEQYRHSAQLGGDHGRTRFNPNVVGIRNRERSSYFVELLWSDLHEYAVMPHIGSPTRESLFGAQDFHDTVSQHQEMSVTELKLNHRDIVG